MMAWLTFHLWARIPLLAARIPAQRAAAVAGASAALGLFADRRISVPTQRTFFMLATVAFFWRWGAAFQVRASCLPRF